MAVEYGMWAIMGAASCGIRGENSPIGWIFNKKIARICIKLYNFVENSTKNLLQPGVASERVGERSIGYKAQ